GRMMVRKSAPSPLGGTGHGVSHRMDEESEVKNRHARCSDVAHFEAKSVKRQRLYDFRTLGRCHVCPLVSACPDIAIWACECRSLDSPRRNASGCIEPRRHERAISDPAD